MSLKNLPSAVFDLGGVLLRWDPPAIVAAVFADPVTRATVHRAVFAHPDWLELDRGTLSEEVAVRRFARRSAQPVGVLRALMEEVRRSLVPLPESVELLAELAAAAVPLYCLSNMHARNVEYLTRTHAFFRFFRDAVYSADVKMIKPDPAIFAHAAARFGLAPECCIFVDDAVANVEVAAAAGWRPLLFVDAAQCRRDLLELGARFAAERHRNGREKGQAHVQARPRRSLGPRRRMGP